MDALQLAAVVIGVSALLIVIPLVCSYRKELPWARSLEQSMEAYRDTHPPISDEEFLKLCDPSISPEVALKVREVLADALGMRKEEIYPDARLIADLGAW